jgi:hypothetical protein
MFRHKRFHVRNPSRSVSAPDYHECKDVERQPARKKITIQIRIGGSGARVPTVVPLFRWT